MTNFSKPIWLILVLVFLLIIIGMFAYQWWQAKGELAEELKEKEDIKEKWVKQIHQNEELMREIADICGKLIKAPLRITITSFKADITLTNPKGDLVVGRWWDPEEKKYRVVDQEFGGMGYGLVDPGGNGKPPTTYVYHGFREIGDYLVTINPEHDALPTDTYTLEIPVNGDEIFTIAKDIPLGNYPRHLYIIRSTEERIIPINPVICGF